MDIMTIHINRHFTVAPSILLVTAPSTTPVEALVATMAVVLLLLLLLLVMRVSMAVLLTFALAKADNVARSLVSSVLIFLVNQVPWSLPLEQSGGEE
jgi:hypothetical protein